MKTYLIAMFLGLFLAVFIHLPGFLLTLAATKNFLQSDWSGGAEVSATVTENSQLGFNQFYSSTSGVNTSTPGIIELKTDITVN
ncbi:MAG: hypothetical protein WCT01_04685 [Candidatus Shapirobacteria bacterium]|jgi:hypothetical protein